MRWRVTLALLFVVISVTHGLYKEPLEPVDTRSLGYSSSIPLDGYKLIKMRPRSSIQLQLVYNMDKTLNITVDFWTRPSSPKGSVDVFLSKEDFLKVEGYLNKKDIPFLIKLSDVFHAMQNENRKHSRYQFNVFTGYDYTRYHNYDGIVREIHSLVSSHSNIASLIDIGKTYENRKQYAVKISVSNSPNRKLFFFTCGMHAREWITPATCMYMLKEMLNGYRSDNEVTAMLNKMDWVIMPVANVDGYSYTWSDYNNRMWRKTRTPHTWYCKGADPNRNFNFKWGVVGVSDDPCSNIYKGPKSFSEKSMYNMANYLYNNRHKLVGFIDIHAYSQLWMTPWGYTKTHPRDYTEQKRVSIAAVRALSRKYGTTYKYGPSSIIIYETSGTSDDWAYGALGVKYSFGLELRDKGRFGFLLPADQILPTGIETFAAFKALSREMKISA